MATKSFAALRGGGRVDGVPRYVVGAVAAAADGLARGCLTAPRRTAGVRGAAARGAGGAAVVVAELAGASRA